MSNPPTISGYRITRPLGRGATARVYLADDRQGRQVALKVLLPEDERQEYPDAAGMFANEVRMTMQLTHDHLVRGYGGQGFDEGAYLALEYFPQGALDSLVQPGRPLPPEQAARILRGVAEGLDYMHRQGAVHQDVKAQNIYLDGDRAVLADLGCSYMMGQGGRVGGSPFYMAPEIYRGEEATAASDVYSLGVLAYEVLAGQRPFEGDDYNELMAQHLNAMPPSLAHLAPELPRLVARTLQQALAKNPDDRPDLLEVMAALNEWLGADVEVGARPEPAAPSGPVLGRHAAPQHEASAPVLTEPESETDAAPGLLARWNPFRKKG
ncbi:serine/threonine-protein kinase [Deinococcus radiophilus]|uniref:Serine/threonine protein kinase n=1 Tax=Deinococcus radiophilus TaxID=32062 RepID=A0A431VF51_9DEIO|nr:serine/threonine-protein kinase [Deinococcus radiophilus]RTR18686.1 serine/threonine protein kinase [Deinococcus radiophilus]UFA49724.1 serine/threonine protein kinase [Deinococcus radiophilus]